jgi:hypothetical protein
MGQLIATVAGGFLGGLLGGPLGASIGMTLGGALGAALFGPTIEGPRLTDLKVSASTYGNAIPEVYGTVRVGTNMIWSPGIKESKKKSGGKGGPKQTTYSYSCSFAAAMCVGTIDGVLRIWADGKLIYDASGGATRNTYQTADLYPTVSYNVVSVIKDDKKKTKYKIRIYKGNEVQLPDSLMEDDKGMGNVSAHRGLAYLVFDTMSLDNFANHVPSITVELTKNMKANFPSLVLYKTDATALDVNRTIPDWNNGRIFTTVAPYGGTAKIGNLDTMQMTYDNPLPIYYSGTYVLIPDSNLAVVEEGDSNSRALRLYDVVSGQKLYSIGKDGISLGGVLSYDSSQIWKRYGALGIIGYAYVGDDKGKTLFIMRNNWLRHVSCFNLSKNPDDLTLFEDAALFVPDRYLNGILKKDVARFVGYRENAGTLELEIYDVGKNAHSEIIGTSPYTFNPSKDWSKQHLILNPFVLLHGYIPLVVLYDHTNDTIFSIGKTSDTGVGCAFLYSMVTNSYVWSKYLPGIGMPKTRMEYSSITGGTFGWIYYQYPSDTSQAYEISLANGDILRQNDIGLNDWGEQFRWGAIQQWHDESSSVTMGCNGTFRRIFFRDGAGKLKVRDIVADLCAKTGVLGYGDYDVSGINASDVVIGYTIDKVTTSRDAIKQLSQGYFFDGYESDYKLKFKSRGGAPILNITEDWLGRDTEGIVVKETMTHELELPRKITVNFYDVALDHQKGSQSAARSSSPVPTMLSPAASILEFPFDWQATDAKQCADKMLKMAWANRWSYALTLPWKYLKYDPSDVITITLNNGTVFNSRASEIHMGADFAIELTAISEKAAAYTSTVVGTSGLGIAPNVTVVSYPVTPVVLNTPLLRDMDYDTSGNATVYLAVTTKAGTFNGAGIFASNGVTDYNYIAGMTKGDVGGIAITVLPPTHSYESTDETTVLKVRLMGGDTLSSVTQDAMLTGYANMALVGGEVIQFRDVVHQTNGEWWLSGLLRARRGTNYAVNTHTVGEDFILLSTDTITKSQRPPEQYFVREYYKAAATGDSSQEATTHPADLIPRDLMPYTPEAFTISDDGTTVTITMQRRSRVTAPLTDVVSVIPYKEGSTRIGAHINYVIWPTLTETDITTVVVPTLTGKVPLFDASGVDIPAVLTFPLSALSGAPKFLLKAYEVGIVDGIPKWIGFERIAINRWNLVEAY